MIRFLGPIYINPSEILEFVIVLAILSILIWYVIRDSKKCFYCQDKKGKRGRKIRDAYDPNCYYHEECLREANKKMEQVAKRSSSKL